MTLAWRRIFGNLGDPDTLNDFRVMFEDHDFLDSRAFRPLHKIVLGLTDMSLKQYLKLTTHDIEAVDVEHRTALAWAASRCDIDAVRTLLQFGADANSSTAWGHRPLHLAAQNRFHSPCEVFNELIRHKADVNAVDYWNRTALVYASGNYDDIEPISILVTQKTNLDVRDRRLRTALGYAVRLRNPKHAKYLYSAGADPNLPDEFGVSPFVEAIRTQGHDTMRLLLPASLPQHIQPHGSSLLHFVAKFGDVKVFKILLEDFSCGLFTPTDLDARDCDESTPGELFEQRSAITEIDREVFDTLICKIRNSSAKAP